MEVWWWEREIAKIHTQAEQVETAMLEVLEVPDTECDEDLPISTTIGCTRWRQTDKQATWQPLVMLFNGEIVFTINASCVKGRGATIVNCSRRIRNRLEMFQCLDFEELLSAAKRYAKEQLLPQLEYVDD
jgi:hypothetical protein